jgi:hypothetical protein
MGQSAGSRCPRYVWLAGGFGNIGRERDVIGDVKLTTLPGEDWIPGPVGSEQRISFAEFKQ